MALQILTIRTVTARRAYHHHFEKQQQFNTDVDYVNDWNHGDAIEQVTIERKIPVPVFVEKIRHIPVPYEKPVYIEKPIPIVHFMPRSRHYHHHHFTEYHHLHWFFLLLGRFFLNIYILYFITLSEMQIMLNVEGGKQNSERNF